MSELIQVIDSYGLIVAFLVVGVIMFISEIISRKIFRSKIPGSAISIFLGLVLGYIGGVFGDGEKGLSDISVFKGIGFMGGGMFRDFTIVATAISASFLLIKKSGLAGMISLFFGLVIFFGLGVLLGWIWGFRDPVTLTTIGAGACTYIIGPVTGAAIGASSDIIALSIGIGVVKTITVTILTPILAKKIGLDSEGAAMSYGGLMGTTSGVAAGLAATDPKLVPYGAVTATFYSGLGCLICPSVFYLILKYFL
jgi:malonate transporter MadM subunit